MTGQKLSFKAQKNILSSRSKPTKPLSSEMPQKNKPQQRTSLQQKKNKTSNPEKKQNTHFYETNQNPHSVIQLATSGVKIPQSQVSSQIFNSSS